MKTRSVKMENIARTMQDHLLVSLAINRVHNVPDLGQKNVQRVAQAFS